MRVTNETLFSTDDVMSILYGHLFVDKQIDVKLIRKWISKGYIQVQYRPGYGRKAWFRFSEMAAINAMCALSNNQAGPKINSIIARLIAERAEKRLESGIIEEEDHFTFLFYDIKYGGGKVNIQFIPKKKITWEVLSYHGSYFECDYMIMRLYEQAILLVKDREKGRYRQK